MRGTEEHSQTNIPVLQHWLCTIVQTTKSNATVTNIVNWKPK